MHGNTIRLPLERTTISREEYSDLWRKTGPLELRMVAKHGRCRHEPGQVFQFEKRYACPAGLCGAMLHVVKLYIWRAALGFPSWEPDDCSVYRLHCPSKTGTVWELRKIAAEEGA